MQLFWSFLSNNIILFIEKPNESCFTLHDGYCCHLKLLDTSFVIITISPDGSNGKFIGVKSPRVSAKGLDRFFNGFKYYADMMLIAAQKC